MQKTNLFKRLRNLFAGSVIVRKADDGTLKVADISGIQAYGKLATNFMARGKFGIYSSAMKQGYHDMAHQGVQRQMMYRDYELMKMDPLIASALNIYADTATVRDEVGDILTIKTEDDEIAQILDNLFNDVLNVEFNLRSWIYSLALYGDFFAYLKISENYGVTGIVPISAYEINREDDYDPDRPGDYRFNMTSAQYPSPYVHKAKDNKNILDNYEVVHMRLKGDINNEPYGVSMLEAGRRIWKSLYLMQDAMILHRITRAPEKRKYKIDVGSIPPNEIDGFMKQMMNQVKKVPFVDPNTGQYNLKYNMQNILEDFWIPVRGSDSGMDVESLPGLEYNAIDDIEFLLKQLLAALQVPKAFLGYDEMMEGKSSLAGQDVRFARTIENIQRVVISELTKIAIVHLYALGYNSDALMNFEIYLTNPSIIYEQEKIALWNERVNLATNMKELRMFSEEWIYKNIFNFSEKTIVDERKRILDDLKNRFRYAQIEGEGNDPFVTGQTFGTPHDLALMNKGDLTKLGDGDYGTAGDDGKSLDYGTTNYQSDFNYGTPESGNITDEPEYDVNYNKNQREPSPVKYGQDTHVAGRDPLGRKGYRNAYSPKNRLRHTLPLNSSFKQTKHILESLKIVDPLRKLNED